MSPVSLWVLAVVGCLVIGREVGKWLFGKNTKLQAAKRAAQALAIKLREFGLRLIPSAARGSGRRRCLRHDREDS